MIVYNKLVRDRIPEIIAHDDMTCVTRILDTEEYVAQLRQKLTEELSEYQASDDLEELADLIEVIYALAQAAGCSEAALNERRLAKRQERGGFERRIFLVSASE